jgi:hypothetical protein
MPSPYKPESRGDPYDTSMENLRKAFASERYHPPRPWRSKEESLMIRRLVLWWHSSRDNNKPPARAWARGLGISHVWLLRLVRQFETDPTEVHRLQRMGDPMSGELDRAKEKTRRMRARGELRSPARRRVPPAIEPATERFVRERFTQGWSKSRLARELFLDRKMVKRILQSV